MAKPYISKPISFDLEALESDPKRIDLEFKRVAHGGASYEGRIFLNNKKASERTPRSHKSYAGSFHVFGHGGCFGGIGHCDVDGPANPYDRRSAHPLTPAFKRVEVTKAVKKAVKAKKKLVVTVVPVVTAATEKCDTENPLRFEKLTLITYD